LRLFPSFATELCLDARIGAADSDATSSHAGVQART